MSAEIIQFVPRPNTERQARDFAAAFTHMIYHVGTTDRSVFDPDAFAQAFGDDIAENCKQCDIGNRPYEGDR